MDALENFARLIQEEHLSWFTASVPLSAEEATLFVRGLEPVDFPFPAERDLQRLYDAAQPASFGVGQETVLDSSYRSARTLVREQFAINLRPQAALLDQVQELLLGSDRNRDKGKVKGKDARRERVRAELYRVNVYGPGDFFKPHKDTPQTGTGHFGSLVVCLPTTFTGGAFVLRSPEGEDVRFDWASCFTDMRTQLQAKTSKSVQAQAQVIAFASDLSHWIEPVESGYRVTVTFHLFREEMSTSLEKACESMLQRVEQREESRELLALQASKRLAGKYVLFPLVHEYSARSAWDVVLKGGDAFLFRWLKKMGVSPQVMFFYEHDEEKEREWRRCWGHQLEEELEEEEENNDRNEGADKVPTEPCYLTKFVKSYTNRGLYESDERPIDEFADRYHVVWARGVYQPSQCLSFGGHYGNEATLEAYYGNVCILTKW